MKLENCEVRPGVVLQVIDNYGRIKASCLGLFSEEDDPDLLPPMSQFLTPSATQFSQPHEGDNIWVWLFSDNPQELLYTFRGNMEKSNNDTLDDEHQDIEILMRRNTENGKIQVDYNTESGYTINNDGTNINIDNEDHDIHIRHKEGPSVMVSKDGISLGTDGKSKYSAVLGEELINVLNDIKDTFNTIKNAAAGSPYTTHIATAMTPAIAKLNNFNKIMSKIVSLDKE